MEKLVIICGGTGGHFFPGLSLAREFQKKGGTPLIIVGGHKYQYQLEEAEKYSIPLIEIPAAKFSKNPIVLFKFIIFFIKGYLRSKKVLKQYKPDRVLSMGSFTSLASAIAAVRLKIPLYLHDGNAKIGKANLLLSRFAKGLMTAFPAVNSKKIKNANIITTGMPLRPEIINGKKSKAEALEEVNKMFHISFNKSKPVILVFGGSLGAYTLNTTIPEVLGSINRTDLQVIHLTGNNYKESSLYENEKLKSLKLKEFDDMSLLFSACDLVISRSGGSTISELIFFNKPAILIPYPFSKDFHQYYNAEYYKKVGNAEIVLNEDCSYNILEKVIISKLECDYNEEDLGKPKASQKILEQISK